MKLVVFQLKEVNFDFRFLQLYDYEKFWRQAQGYRWTAQKVRRGCDRDYERAVKRVVVGVASDVTNWDRRKTQRNSWASVSNIERVQSEKNVQMAMVFVVGHNQQMSQSEKRSLKREMALYGDVIQGNFLESYFNLTLKVQLLFDWTATHCSEWDFLVKTDDDMYLNLDLLAGYVSTIHSAEEVFAGKYFLYQKPHRDPSSKWHMARHLYPRSTYPPFCIGALYMLNLRLVLQIHK